MCQHDIEANGWTAVPVDAGKIFGDKPFLHEPAPISVQDIQFPSDDPVVAKTLTYAKERLHAQTFNHSMRVFYYGMAITKQQFPEKASSFSPATWALTCLLHDIGTAEENLTATRMSFDIYGGIKALDALKDHGATTDQAEAVCEAIIRHQDMGVDGTITYLGQLIQLATLYDNVGRHPNVKAFDKMVHDKTRREINDAHPRLGWCSFFAGTIRKEEEIKPWCHSTHIVGFDREIESNTLMKEWE
ncbi:Cyanamide hydratase [Colletotrichum gloeosporioides]|uniref:Cyanamide hydratase n=1 Tax=Colletotrichum gloeosporioides TaxID=474922 RepID=A0A8H4CWX1_COLGL|nr:Cyanamide hydratase [Colletotrichum gloeosporioides]KAF3811618.1 Cyanamide hydratase [Colletotrichum gloeosporioides]